MNRHLPVAIALLAALSACQLKAPLPTPAKPSPSAGRTVGANSRPEPAQLLKPAPDTLPFTGQVSVDAGYATQHGATTLGSAVGLDGAKLINQDGASIVAQGGGNLINQDGASLVNAGGQIVAQGGGNVIVSSTLITQDGASLITQDGASLITGDPNAIISTHGTGIISTDGASYHLAQAAAADAPAAGMWVSVLDLASGLPLPLGQDAKGKPVFWIYSDAQGKFTVHLPKDVAANVRVLARSPGAADPRLSLHVVAKARGEGVRQVDDVRASSTAYLRFVLANKLLQLIKASPDAVAGYFTRLDKNGTDPAKTAALKAVFVGPLTTLKTAFQQAGADTLPPQRQLELAILASDSLVADIDLDAIALNYDTYEPLVDTPSAVVGVKSMAALAEALDRTAQAAKTAGGANLAGYFAAKPYVQAANALRPACAPYRFERAIDVADFLVQEYLTTTDDKVLDILDHIFRDLRVPIVQRDRIRAGGVTIFQALAQRLFAATDDGLVVDRVAKRIQEGAARLAKAPSPAPAPADTCPTVVTPGPKPDPVGTISTVAGPTDGSKTSGKADGVGPAARFATPFAITADPKAVPPVLYVTDADGFDIRRIRVDAAGVGAVETLIRAVLPQPPTDGVQGTATLARPRGLAMGPDGALYFSDSGQHAVRKLELSPTPRVTTLVRDEARLVKPGHLAVTPDGERLLVADDEGNAIWQLPLAGTDHPLTYLAGNGKRGDLDADHAGEARLNTPEGLAFGPDGTLYFNQGDGYVRRIEAPVTPDAPTAFIAGLGYDRPTLDGFWSNAIFNRPSGLAIDAQGRLVIADTFTHRLRVLTPDGWAGTLAGSGRPGQLGSYRDGPADQAMLDRPAGIVRAPDGNFYFTEVGNNTVRRFVPGKR